MSKEVAEFNGLVLARHNYRESDMLVKLMTDRFGKKMFMLHRARKPGFRMAAGFFCHSLWALMSGRSMTTA